MSNHIRRTTSPKDKIRYTPEENPRDFSFVAVIVNYHLQTLSYLDQVEAHDEHAARALLMTAINENPMIHNDRRLIWYRQDCPLLCDEEAPDRQDPLILANRQRWQEQRSAIVGQEEEPPDFMSLTGNEPINIFDLV